MSVICKDSNGNAFIFVKGAPDIILDLCSTKQDEHGPSIMDQSEKERVVDINEEMAGQALRVLGFAYKKLDGAPQIFSDGEMEKDLIFVGLEGMMDPPRPETFESVQSCYRAGIRPVMITGDHRVTAIAVAREIGMKLDEENVMTGKEVEEMDGWELEESSVGISIRQE